MTEVDVEIVLQRAREKYPEAHPTIISDDGSAFVTRDFKIFLRETGTRHVRTSPYYRRPTAEWNAGTGPSGAMSSAASKPSTPDQAPTVVGRYVHYYNDVRLHSSLGYITPADMLAGKEAQIWKQRDAKLEAARARRLRRQRLRSQESVRDTTIESSSL